MADGRDVVKARIQADPGPVEQGEKVGEHEVRFHFGLWSLHGNGVGQFDKPDLDLGALPVELAFEVLSRV